ncbi:hypothetical protein ACO2WH_26070, partial [Escherichia coli]
AAGAAGGVRDATQRVRDRGEQVAAALGARERVPVPVASGLLPLALPLSAFMTVARGLVEPPLPPPFTRPPALATVAPAAPPPPP